MQTSNALDPQSPQARAIYDLAIPSTIIFALIFVIVTGAIIYAILRFRGGAGEPDPKQIPGNRKVEIAWTIIPFLIVILLLAMTISAMNRADPPPAPSPDLVITGHQFWWQVDYPGSGAITANEIHIPTGKPLSVRLESKDVLHEFWVPELTRKMTNVPGQPNHIWLQADKPGTYIGQCSEFCGTQHAWMRILVVADEPSKFEEWQRAQLQPGQAATSDVYRKRAGAVSNINLHQLSCYPRSSWSGFAGRAGSHARCQSQTTWRRYSGEYAGEHAPLAEKPAARQARCAHARL